MSQTNPERDQDRTADLVEVFRRHGWVMEPQQRAIYRQVAERVAKCSVIEFGCGLGFGSGMLHEASLRSDGLVATDKLPVNVAFAKEAYPWIDFRVYEAGTGTSFPLAMEVGVAVEVIEHVADPVAVLRDMIHYSRWELWLSTPNGKGRRRPPENPFHVCEYTPREVVEMVGSLDVKTTIQVLSWEDFSPQGLDTDVHPLVYRITK